MYFYGSYFTKSEADRAKRRIERLGAKVVKVEKGKGKFPLRVLTVYRVYTNRDLTMRM